MPSLKDIKSRIKSVITTQKTTKAMKMVSAAKLRKAQDTLMRLRPYANKLNELLSRLVASLEGSAVSSPYTDDGRPVVNVLLILVTSNRGLAGAFNNAISKRALEAVQEKYTTYQASGNLQVLAIGKRGFDFMRKRGFRMVEDRNWDVFNPLSYEAVDAVAEYAMKGYIDGKWDRVELVYNEFKNALSQNRIATQFLPLQVDSAATVAATKGKAPATVDYIYEPEQASIITDLIPMILKTRLYRAVLESNLGEHSARMVAMDSATENATELLGNLRLSYNKARQAAITKELIEIVSGANALAAA